MPVFWVLVLENTLLGLYYKVQLTNRFDEGFQQALPWDFETFPNKIGYLIQFSLTCDRGCRVVGANSSW